MSVSDIIESRGIDEVVHFTTHQGVVGVLDARALRSRRRIDSDARLAFILKRNAEFRKDREWTDYVSLSISEINRDFFEISSGSWHRDVSWAILAFDPIILTHPGVYFVTTNNIYPSAIRGEGPHYLEKMFSRVVEGRYQNKITRPEDMDPALPTDRQAEVLYPGQVSTEYLKRIYVDNESEQDNICAIMEGVCHSPVDVIVDPNKFGKK